MRAKDRGYSLVEIATVVLLLLIAFLIVSRLALTCVRTVLSESTASESRHSLAVPPDD